MKITGLTEHQLTMINIMWSLSSSQDLENFQQSLNENDYKLCIALQDLLIAEYIDELIIHSSDITDMVNAIIQKAKTQSRQ